MWRSSGIDGVWMVQIKGEDIREREQDDRCLEAREESIHGLWRKMGHFCILSFSNTVSL